MKKLDFLFVCLMTAYLAGMYRYLPLMILANLAFGFWIVSFFLSRYFRRNLAVNMLLHNNYAEKDAALTCHIKVENTGKLPVSRFQVKFRYGYGQAKQTWSKRIYGGCEQGESRLCFEVVGSCCGMLYLNMNRLYVYDYLSLFSASKKLEEGVKIAVFPRQKALQLESASFGCQESYLPQAGFAGRGEDARSEIRQLREYRRGDTNRYIHWNQSARMDELWVKEYEKESDYKVLLYLSLEGIREAGPSELDCFYELLSALVLGLLKKVTMVQVSWYHEEKSCFVDREISDAAQCRDMLLALYLMEERHSEEDQNAIKKKYLMKKKRSMEDFCTEKNAWETNRKTTSENYFRQDGFRLDMELGWYWKETLIFRFSKEELEAQIAHEIFRI